MYLSIFSPKIYNEMADKRSYTTAIYMVAAVVLSLYALIISVGYYYYGEHTQIPGKKVWVYMRAIPWKSNCFLFVLNTSHGQYRERLGKDLISVIAFKFHSLLMLYNFDTFAQQGNPLASSASLKVIAALGLICNIQVTCPIMVITIAEMVTTVVATSTHAPRIASKSITLGICGLALIIALFLRQDFVEVGEFKSVQEHVSYIVILWLNFMVV